MTKAPKALVIGDDTRAFLAVVRSLGRGKIEVHAAPFDFKSSALKSRYISKIHFIPYYMENGSEWISAMTDLLEAERFDLVIPCDERAILTLQLNRAHFSRLTKLAIPSDRAIEVLFDKQETRTLAQSLGIPIARGGSFDEKTQSSAIIEQIGLPIFVKPRRSFSIDNLYGRAKVIVVRNIDELEAELARKDAAPRIFEQQFEGRGIGLSVLASRGRILQRFEHHRVRENAGASYYRVSAPVNAELASACAKIITALDYTGLAMYEFRFNDASGNWVLLEINARPWGSLPLPVALGVDFPYRWLELLVNGRETPEQPYRAGIYGRNLLPDLREVAALALDARRGFDSKIVAASREIARILAGRERFDVWAADDPAPAVDELGGVVSELFKRDTRVLLPKDMRRAVAIQRMGYVVGAVHDRAPTILFVCQGNICRSPFAAELLKRALSKSVDGGAIIVRSAGMLPRPGRSSPAFAISAARQFDIDLSTHSAQHLDPSLAAAADIIFVFDSKNELSLAQRYPRLRAPVFSLALLSGVSGLEDPDGKNPEDFASVYNQIARGIDLLARRLSAGLSRRSSSEPVARPAALPGLSPPSGDHG